MHFCFKKIYVNILGLRDHIFQKIARNNNKKINVTKLKDQNQSDLKLNLFKADNWLITINYSVIFEINKV